MGNIECCEAGGEDRPSHRSSAWSSPAESSDSDSGSEGRYDVALQTPGTPSAVTRKGKKQQSKKARALNMNLINLSTDRSQNRRAKALDLELEGLGSDSSDESDSSSTDEESDDGQRTPSRNSSKGYSAPGAPRGLKSNSLLGGSSDDEDGGGRKSRSKKSSKKKDKDKKKKKKRDKSKKG